MGKRFSLPIVNTSPAHLSTETPYGAIEFGEKTWLTYSPKCGLHFRMKTDILGSWRLFQKSNQDGGCPD
jgi:hypothetical protein